MPVIFDIETDSKKVEKVTQVWCIATIDTETQVAGLYGPDKIEAGLQYLGEVERLIGHNVRDYDLPVLERLYGFEPKGEVIDTLMLSRMIFNGLSDQGDRYGMHSLEAWGRRLGCHKGEWTDFKQWSPKMGDYCMKDCRTTQKLRDFLRQQRPKGDAVRMEFRYEALMRKIESHGFAFDVEGCEKLKEKLEWRMRRFQGYLDQTFPPKVMEGKKPSWHSFRMINPNPVYGPIPEFTTKTELARWRKDRAIKPREIELIEGPPEKKILHFNANSPQQVVEGLMSLGWQPSERNESGSVNTSEAVLWSSGIREGRLIAAYRGYSKLHSFCKQWLKYCKDGRIHPKFVSLRAATGRSSAKAPNIQQIPTDGQRKSGMKLLLPYGRRCRRLFRASEGYVLVGADLAGIEVRLLGHQLAPYDRGEFADMVSTGADVHQRNADSVGVSRDRAKTVLYGSMYGQGASSLAGQLGITENESRSIIEAFTKGLPGFDQMKNRLLLELRQTGRITLIDGRRIQVNSEHKALNYLIQGDAAIMMKHWALCVDQSLAGSRSFKLLAIVHDEMQSECHPEEAADVCTIFTKSATGVGRELGFRVPIEATAKVGQTWQETH